jgi:hypothetical protein
MEWRSLIRRKRDEISLSWVTPGWRPYAEAARGLPEILVKNLLRQQIWAAGFRAKLRARLMVPFVSTGPLDALPWESYLIEAVSQWERDRASSQAGRAMRSTFEAIDHRMSGLTEFNRIQIYRGAEPLSGEAVSPIWSGGRVSLSGGRMRAVGLEDCWREHHAEVSWYNPIISVPPLFDVGENVKILHLIGRATRSGSRWELLITGAPLGAPSPYPNEEIIVPVEHLPVRRVSLVVLQLDPAESPYRFESDREQVGELRALAARVFAEGAHAVMVLPQMSPSLSLHVVSALATALPGSLPEPPELGRLLDAVSIVRQAIVSQPIEPSQDQPQQAPPGAVAGQDARREMALDVCLFARGSAPP